MIQSSIGGMSASTEKSLSLLLLFVGIGIAGVREEPLDPAVRQDR
jgi:hypothetical protein